ncbi:MAG: ArnT family glycosyltransferase [Alphaproteobacteria bacterium]
MQTSGVRGIHGGAKFGDWSWDRLAACFLVLLAVVAALTFRDYGITWDEEIQQVYGEKLLAYYGSLFQDRSVFSLDNLFYYGGLFEIAAGLIVKVSPFGLYETRHLLGALVGILGAAGSWRLGRLLGGPRAGVIALVLTALTPAYYGHSFFNPKDIPFACALIWALFFACRLGFEFPTPRLRNVLGFGLTLGCALGIRVGGGLVLVYLAIAISIHGVLRLRTEAFATVLRDTVRFVARLLPALPVAYAVMAIFWPWSVQALFNPIDALLAFSKMQWPGKVLMDGSWMPPPQLPLYYLPLILAIQLPEVTLLGLAGAAGLAIIWAAKGRARTDRLRALPRILLVVALLFPIAYSAAFRPNVFNGYRHFLFLVPVASVAAALAWDRLWEIAVRRAPGADRWISGALGTAMLWQMLTLAALFPNEYIYYNAFIGGVRGAAGRFETDYWGSSLREATEDLEQLVKKESDGKAAPRRYSVAVVCANPMSASYFFPWFLYESKQVNDADFVVERANADCSVPIGGRIVAQVKRSGVVLSIVFDRRSIRRNR